MALTDINISEQLETSAPSIKYEGNEGPKSPEEQRMVQLKQEYMAYVFEQKEIGTPIMSFEEWYQMVYEASKMGVDAGQQPQQPQQPQPQMRQPVAYGGIMDVGGRRRYGFGSRLRKLIPNEISRVAEKAAPFVAPFNPAVAGLMSGVGGFDRHGSIGKGLKSGLMNYAGGQAARYMGGADLQGMSLKMPGATTGGGIGNYFSKPIGPNKTIFSGLKEKFTGGGGGGDSFLGYDGPEGTESLVEKLSDKSIGDVSMREMNFLKEMNKPQSLKLLDKYAMPAIMGAMGLAGAMTKPQDMQEAAKMARGKGIDIDGIRAEVQAALAGGEAAWAELQKKYPYVGEFPTKKAAEGGRIGYQDAGQVLSEGQITQIKQMGDMGSDTSTISTITGATEEQINTVLNPPVESQAQGGRIGLYAGGQSIPSEYTMEDAMMTTTQDKLGGITDVMKQADQYRQGDIGQFYAAQGGRIGYRYGKNYKSNQGSNEMKFNMDAKLKYLREMGASDEEIYEIIVLGKDISDQYKSLGELEGKGERRAEPFYPDRFEGQRRAEPFYPDRFEGRLEPMAQGGRIGAEEGGLMDLGGMEKDYRNDGGFVPLGGEEKADDVPARLSKNEFVFTADAVRGAGGGDIDKGAEIMENIMKNLEQGGQISEETQGLTGAQEMFDVSERLSEVV